MAAVADVHTRLVSWLKILLPLAALGILSTLFLVSRTIDPSQTIPYADVDVDELARTQRIGAPSYSGMTQDGAAISFVAVSARPEGGPEGRVVALHPVTRLELPTGRVLELSAVEGYLDQQDRLAALDGGVVLETSDGWRLETQTATARLDASAMQTAGEVIGTAPMGEIRAGRAVLERQEGGDYVLRFEGGVDLVYRPGN